MADKPFVTRKSEAEFDYDLVEVYKTAAPALSQSEQLRQRVYGLMDAMPELAGDPTALINLANQPGSASDVLGGAVAGIGYMQISQKAEEFNGYDDKTKRSVWANLSPNQQQALIQQGAEPPVAQNAPERGFFDRFVSNVGKYSSIGGKAFRVGVTAPMWPVKQGLKGMAWMGEAMTTFPRAGEQYQDIAELRARLEAQGIDPDAYAAERGMELPNAQPNRGKLLGAIPVPGFAQDAMNTVGGLVNAQSAFVNPKDLISLWRMQGVEGDDDFLMSKKLDTYDILEETYGDDTPVMYQRVYAMASGKDMTDIAKDEGYEEGTPEFEQFIGELYAMKQEQTVRDAVSGLVGARMSLGRNVARNMGYDDQDLTDSSSPAKWISGSLDLTYTVAIDPTIVAGKVAVASRAARWGMRTTETIGDVNRAQELAGIAQKLEEAQTFSDPALRKAVSDLVKETIDTSMVKGGLARRSFSAKRDLIAEGKAYYEFNKRVARAWDEADEGYTLAQLVRELPNTAAGLFVMNEWHNMAKAGAFGDDLIHGLSKAENVPEFFKHQASMRQLAGTKFFGKNSRNMFVPKINIADKLRIERKQAFREMLIDGKTPLPKAVLDDITEEARRLKDDLPEGAFDDLLNWQPTKVNQLQKFTRGFTTQTPKLQEGGLKLLATEGRDQSEIADDIIRFIEYGNLADMPRYAKDAYVDRIIRGNLAERAAVVNQFMADFLTRSGAIDATDEAGQKLLDKYIAHANQAYGISDSVTLRTSDGLRSVTRDAVLSTQLSDQVAIPSFKELVIATRRANTLRRVFGTVNGNSTYEALFGRVFKPLQLMRLGYIVRSASEEVLSTALRMGSKDYLKAKIATDWALGQKSAGAAISPGMARMAFLRPVVATTHGMRSIVKATDEDLATKARSLMHTMPEYGKVPEAELFDRARTMIERKRGVIPKTVVHIDDFATYLSRTGAQFFHEVARKTHIPSKMEIGQKIAGDRLLRSTRAMMSTPAHQQVWADMIGQNTFRGIHDTTNYRSVLMRDDSSPSGLVEIAMRVDMSDFKMTSQADLSTFYWKATGVYDSLARSVEGRVALRAHMNFVGPDVERALSNLFNAEDGMALAKSLKEAAKSDTTGYVKRWLKSGEDLLDDELAQLDDQLADAIRIFQQPGVDARARYILSPHGSPNALTNDPAQHRRMLADNIYNELRRLDTQDELRKRIRINTVNGKLVAQPIKDGVKRVYVPMIDRRAAIGLEQVFTTQEGAEMFAKNLEKHLSRKGLRREMAAVWDTSSASFSGWSVQDYMSAIHAKQVINGGEWIPATLSSSSNPEVARALRDALQETFDAMQINTVVNPTIGHLDIPENFQEAANPLFKRWGDTDIVHVNPAAAIKAEPINPNDLVTLHKVKLKDGKTIWVGDDEFETVLSMDAQASALKANKTKRSPKLVRYNKKNDRIDVNVEAIEDDFNGGLKFLRGEGIDRTKRRQTYDFSEADLAKVQQIEDVLNNGFIEDVTIPSLHEYVQLYKGMKKADRELLKTLDDKFAYTPWGYLMGDEEMLADVVVIAERAKKGEVLTEIVQSATDSASSKTLRKSLERMGIDVDKFADSLTLDDYQAFLVERERAARALGHRWSPGDVANDEKIMLDMQANAYALKRVFGDSDIYDEISLTGVGADIKLPTPPVGNSRESVEILDTIIGSGVTEDVAVRRAAEDAADHVMSVMMGRKSGDSMWELAHHLNEGDFATDDLWLKGNLEDLPTDMLGPTLLVPDESKWARVQSTWFEGMASPAIGAISRSPLYRMNHVKAMDQTEWVYRGLLNTDFEQRAHAILKKVDIEPELFDDYIELMHPEREMHFKSMIDDVAAGDPWLVFSKRLEEGKYDEASKALMAALPEGNKAYLISPDGMHELRRWINNRSTAYTQWRDTANLRAYNLTIPYIDDHRIRSQFQEYIGHLIPFWYAQEQFLKRIGRGLLETPYAIRKGQLLMNGFRDMGVIREDDQGNEVFIWPGSELGVAAVARATELITGEKYLIPKFNPLAMRTDFMIPGYTTDDALFNFGPMVGMPMEFASRRFPEFELAQKEITGFGSGRAYWEYILPGWMANAYKTAMLDADKGQMMSAQAEALQYLAANDLIPAEDASALDKEKFAEDLRMTARTIMLLRTFTSFTGPTSGRVVIDRKMLSKEFTDLMEDGADMETAFDLFIEKYGAEALPYTVFKSENMTFAKLPSTEESFKFMVEHEDFFKAYPQAAAFFLPQARTDDAYEARAYREQLALGLRKQRTPDELLTAIYEAQASGDYWDKRDEYEAKISNATGETKKMLEAEWKLWSDIYLNQHPVFADGIRNPETAKKREIVLRDMTRIMYDPSTPQSPALDEIRPLVENYNTYRSYMDQIKDQRGKAAKQEKEYRTDQFYTWAYQYTSDKPNAKMFWNSILRRQFSDSNLYDAILKDGANG